MRNRGMILIAMLAWFVASGVLGSAGQAPGAPRRGGNPEAAKRVNPVAASPESTAAGRRAYTQYCANCHGSAGKGDGSGGAAGAAPADLTDATWDYGSTDGEIFGVIHDGTSNDMVNYIRSLAKK